MQCLILAVIIVLYCIGANRRKKLLAIGNNKFADSKKDSDLELTAQQS